MVPFKFADEDMVPFEELDNETQKEYNKHASLLIEGGYSEMDIDTLARRIYERRMTTS
jgi:hypothetical protein